MKMRYSACIKIVPTLSIIGCCFVGAMCFRRVNWESLIFVLSDQNGNSLNRKCSQLSDYFCTFGHIAQGGVRRHFWGGESSTHVFSIATANTYRSINWFSFDEHEFGGCCDYQQDFYKKQGRDRGLSPFEYHAKMMDFSSQGKQLNYISVRSDEDACRNVISAIGFGSGRFSYTREDHRVNRETFHTFPQKWAGGVRMYNPFDLFNNSTHLEQVVDFDWFKRNFICYEQPWLCSVFGPIYPGVSPLPT
ncbi:uncharacterized protein LOC142342301 [Convolutriloba macropyga]|uniref:uncharacterized protein LOC142342301 n=1 Tax=Convolutriloba macropyga TaxID=536237 RepID=UPI003F5279E1